MLDRKNNAKSNDLGWSQWDTKESVIKPSGLVTESMQFFLKLFHLVGTIETTLDFVGTTSLKIRCSAIQAKNFNDYPHQSIVLVNYIATYVSASTSPIKLSCVVKSDDSVSL